MKIETLRAIYQRIETVMKQIILIPPIFLIVYALPYCFTIPTTRISLPFTNNTAEATSILLVSSFFLFVFYRLRFVPLYWRVCTTVSLSLIGFVWFEVIHVINLHSFRTGYSAEYDLSFLFKNMAIVVGILGILYLINLYASTTYITGSICVWFIVFIIMTVFQISRDWYNVVFNDPYTVLYKAVGIWMWLSVVKRNDK